MFYIKKFSKFYFYFTFIAILQRGLINCHVWNSSNSSDQDKSEICYFESQKTQTTWKLIWEEKFNDVTKFASEWIVEDGDKDCIIFYPQVITCSSLDNFHLENGYLVLRAKYDDSKDRFTGVIVSSKRQFTEGRYEIRATQPLAPYIQTCLYTMMEDARSFRKNKGIILIHCHNPPDNPARGFFYREANKTGSKPAGFNYDPDEGFHLFGVEWNQREIRYFIDHQYSVPYVLDGHLNDKHRIHLSIMMRKVNNVAPPITVLEGECPVFLIDHVRIYQAVNNQNQSFQINSSQRCSFPPRNESSFDKSKFCNISNVEENIVLEESVTTTNRGFSSILLSITFGLILCLLGIVYFLSKLYRTRKQQKIENDSNINNDQFFKELNSSSDEYYEEINYDFVDDTLEYQYLEISDEVTPQNKPQTRNSENLGNYYNSYLDMRIGEPIRLVENEDSYLCIKN